MVLGSQLIRPEGPRPPVARPPCFRGCGRHSTSRFGAAQARSGRPRPGRAVAGFRPGLPDRLTRTRWPVRRSTTPRGLSTRGLDLLCAQQGPAARRIPPYAAGSCWASCRAGAGGGRRRDRAMMRGMATYVLVHGGWSGAHGFRHVRRLLHAAGHECFTPSLTGLGERAHLASPQVRLSTHVEDVVNHLLYEDHRDVVLLGPLLRRHGDHRCSRPGRRTAWRSSSTSTRSCPSTASRRSR